jgi:hypothetical protein
LLSGKPDVLLRQVLSAEGGRDLTPAALLSGKCRVSSTLAPLGHGDADLHVLSRHSRTLLSHSRPLLCHSRILFCHSRDGGSPCPLAFANKKPSHRWFKVSCLVSLLARQPMDARMHGHDKEEGHAR